MFQLALIIILCDHAWNTFSLSGYAISWKTLELLCPVLPTCQEKARSENEDVEVARCIRIYAGINCTTAHEVKETSFFIM